MSLLLDTHALLWWLDDVRLSADIRREIGDSETRVVVSVATLWEVGIKVKNKKMVVEVPLGPIVEREGFEIMAISAPHAEAAGALPLHHRDPFDRLLIAQAQLEHLTLVTRDREFADYDVATMPC